MSPHPASGSLYFLGQSETKTRFSYRISASCKTRSVLPELGQDGMLRFPKMRAPFVENPCNNAEHRSPFRFFCTAASEELVSHLQCKLEKQPDSA